MVKRSLDTSPGLSHPQKKARTGLLGIADSVKSIFRAGSQGSLLDDIALVDAKKRHLQLLGSSSYQPIDLTRDYPPSHYLAGVDSATLLEDVPPPSRALAGVEASIQEDAPPPSRALALTFPLSQPSTPITSLFPEGSLKASSQLSYPSSAPRPRRPVDKRPNVIYTPPPRERHWQQTSTSPRSDRSSSSSSSSRRRRRERYTQEASSSNFRRGRPTSKAIDDLVRQAGLSPEKRRQLERTMYGDKPVPATRTRAPLNASHVGLRHHLLNPQNIGRQAFAALISSSERASQRQTLSETLKDPAKERLAASTASSSADFLRKSRSVAEKASKAKASRPLPEAFERFRLEDEEIDRSLKSRRTWIPAELPKDKEKYVKSALKNPAFSAKCLREEVKAHDLTRLRPCQWLNDEIINFYGAMVQKRSDEDPESKRSVHYFSSFFYKKLKDEGYETGRLKRWSKKVDLFTKDIIVFPININNVHWTCGAINIRDKRFEFYDSMGDRRSEIYRNMRAYLSAEHLEKKGSKLDLSEWIDYWNPDSPQQHNAYDCGVFSCITLEALARGREPTDSEFEFGQDHMDVLRKLIIWEIGHSELVPRT